MKKSDVLDSLVWRADASFNDPHLDDMSQFYVFLNLKALAASLFGLLSYEECLLNSYCLSNRSGHFVGPQEVTQ